MLVLKKIKKKSLKLLTKSLLFGIIIFSIAGIAQLAE